MAGVQMVVNQMAGPHVVVRFTMSFGEIFLFKLS